jgi:competence protein ComFB
MLTRGDLGGEGVLFKNYMEEVVDGTIEEILSYHDDVCGCERCRLDIKALALNHLPPKYVVTDIGYVYTKINELESQFKADVAVAVTNAIKVVRKNPRHAETS